VRQGDVFFGEVSGVWMLGVGRGLKAGSDRFGVVVWLSLRSLLPFLGGVEEDGTVLLTVTTLDGIGLGLSIVREATELAGGRVDVSSVPGGRVQLRARPAFARRGHVHG